MDFHEIFRDGVVWSSKTKNNFSCDDVRDIDDFLILMVSFCDAIFSETTLDIFFKFSRMIDKGLKFIPREAFRSKSAEVLNDVQFFFEVFKFSTLFFKYHFCL